MTGYLQNGGGDRAKYQYKQLSAVLFFYRAHRSADRLSSPGLRTTSDNCKLLMPTPTLSALFLPASSSELVHVA